MDGSPDIPFQLIVQIENFEAALLCHSDGLGSTALCSVPVGDAHRRVIHHVLIADFHAPVEIGALTGIDDLMRLPHDFFIDPEMIDSVREAVPFFGLVEAWDCQNQADGGIRFGGFENALCGKGIESECAARYEAVESSLGKGADQSEKGIGDDFTVPVYQRTMTGKAAGERFIVHDFVNGLLTKKQPCGIIFLWITGRGAIMVNCWVQIGDAVLREYVISALELAGIRCTGELTGADVLCCCDDGVPAVPDGFPVVILYRRPRYTRTPAYASLSERCRCIAVERPFLLEELIRAVTEMAEENRMSGDTGSVRETVSADKRIVLRREDTSMQVGKTVIRFTEREFRLLELLAERAETVVSRETILAEAWEGAESNSNAVDVYIGYLRRKLEPSLGKGVIVAVRGAGYQFTAGGKKLRIR